MGKGAGGCDDRPAFAINGAVLAGEQSTIELSPYDRLMIHRETFPGNNMLVLGTPADLSESDRIRFRKMIKDLEGGGERVQTWEQSPDEPTIEFYVGHAPYWTGQGQFQNYRNLQITVNGEDDKKVNRINLVQQAMQQYGFFAVVTFKQELQPTWQEVAHDSTMDNGQILQAECNGMVQYETGIINDIEDEAEVNRAIAIFTIEGMKYADVDEQKEWIDSGMSPEEITGWLKLDLNSLGWTKEWTDEGFDLAEATEWIAGAEWNMDEASNAAMFRNAGISPRRAQVLYDMDLDYSDEYIFNEEIWEQLEIARAGYKEDGDSWYAGENLQGFLRRYRDDQESPFVERDLEWITAGFDVYRSPAPWETWEGYTPQQANEYRQAGYDKPPADEKVLQVTQTWQKACPDLSLEGPEIEELIKQGVQPKEFQQARKIIGDDDYTKEAFTVGWTVPEMVEWKDLLRQHAWRTDRVRELQQVGATPAEAGLFFEAGVDAKHYQAFKEMFSNK